MVTASLLGYVGSCCMLTTWHGLRRRWEVKWIYLETMWCSAIGTYSVWCKHVCFVECCLMLVRWFFVARLWCMYVGMWNVFEVQRDDWFMLFAFRVIDVVRKLWALHYLWKYSKLLERKQMHDYSSVRTKTLCTRQLESAQSCRSLEGYFSNPVQLVPKNSNPWLWEISCYSHQLGNGRENEFTWWWNNYKQIMWRRLISWRSLNKSIRRLFLITAPLVNIIIEN